MSAEHHTKSSSALVLFSVIVSLIPAVHTSDLPISGWYERELSDSSSNANNTTSSSQQQQPQQSSPSNLKQQQDADTKHIQRKASNSFLAVRQIHVSLARLCRVLAREEQRCRYVAIQSDQLQTIRADFNANREKHHTHSEPIGKRRHRRTMTGGSIAGGSTIVTEMAMDATTKHHDDHRREEETRERQQRDQEITDLLLAAKVEGVHGNLARELLQVFHALSQTNQSSTPTSSAILSARDSTVFINRHLAVPIESVAKDLCQEVAPIMRPYHTLLFPQVTAKELAESFSSSNSRMKQFLTMLDPGKSLSDIAHESSGIPLSMIIEMANHLITNRTCIISHVINKRSILACCHDAILRMRDLSLQFSELFHHLSIHTVVSALTRGWSIDELMDRLLLDDDVVVLVGGVFQELVRDVRTAREEDEKVRQQAQEEEKVTTVTSNFGVEAAGTGGTEKDAEDALSPYVLARSALEDFIVAMATWLGAHRTIIPKNEYFLSGSFGFDSRSSLRPYKQHQHQQQQGVSSSYEESSRMNNNNNSQVVEETLYKELRDEGGLNGRISVIALRWRFGLDETTIRRLRRWGLQVGKIRSIVRVPNVEDDEWGSTD